jgi:hypothetical protein
MEEHPSTYILHGALSCDYQSMMFVSSSWKLIFQVLLLWAQSWVYGLGMKANLSDRHRTELWWHIQAPWSDYWVQVPCTP